MLHRTAVLTSWNDKSKSPWAKSCFVSTSECCLPYKMFRTNVQHRRPPKQWHPLHFGTVGTSLPQFVPSHCKCPTLHEMAWCQCCTSCTVIRHRNVPTINTIMGNTMKAVMSESKDYSNTQESNPHKLLHNSCGCLNPQHVESCLEYDGILRHNSILETSIVAWRCYWK